MFKFLLSLGIIAENTQSTDAKKEKRNGTIKGGDYIDYEEVK